jgi:hypothetical protein
MTEPARANHDGHPCPPWCVTDHNRELIPGALSASHSSELAHPGAGTGIAAVLFPSSGEPEVQVCTPGAGGGSIFLPARTAGYLAVLIGELAAATPAQHRELAAAIRHAAAQITEA